MAEFVLVWYNERCEICRCWQGCFIVSPCTLNQLFGCWYAWHLSLNGLTSESDGLIANLRRKFHCIQGSAFWSFVLATSTPAASLPSVWCPSRWRSGLPAHLSTRLKGAPSSFLATGDVILSAPHVAATALLHRFMMTLFTSECSRHWQLRITYLQNLFVLSAEKAWKVNMNSASMSFFLPWEVPVLTMAQIWRTCLRMCCSGLYTEGRNIKRGWRRVGIIPVAWHFTCQTVLSLRCNIKGISYNTLASVTFRLQLYSEGVANLSSTGLD